MEYTTIHNNGIKSMPILLQAEKANKSLASVYEELVWGKRQLWQVSCRDINMLSSINNAMCLCMCMCMLLIAAINLQRNIVQNFSPNREMFPKTNNIFRLAIHACKHTNIVCIEFC